MAASPIPCGLPICPGEAPAAAPRPLSVALVFLAAILVGALAVALADGTFQLNLGLDREMLQDVIDTFFQRPTTSNDTHRIEVALHRPLLLKLGSKGQRH